MRMKELFFQFDKDHSGDITRDEFKTGLKECGIKMGEVFHFYYFDFYVGVKIRQQTLGAESVNF